MDWNVWKLRYGKNEIAENDNAKMDEQKSTKRSDKKWLRQEARGCSIEEKIKEGFFKMVWACVTQTIKIRIGRSDRIIVNWEMRIRSRRKLGSESIKKDMIVC